MLLLLQQLMHKIRLMSLTQSAHTLVISFLPADAAGFLPCSDRGMCGPSISLPVIVQANPDTAEKIALLLM